MTHYLGPVIVDGRSFDHNSGLDLTPPAGPLGGPRFLILHFDNVSLSGSARLEVELGYGKDVFAASAGDDVWTRPVDPAAAPIEIRIVGGSGSARLREYGAGQPSITPGHTPGTSQGSQSNPDPFLHTNPYVEPIYETRLECNPGFAWQNSACALASISSTVRNKVRAASGIVFLVHDGHVSSCSGTLIGSDLFLTARHCFTDPNAHDVASASVTLDYATQCDGSRPPGHAPRFHKVTEVAFSARPPESTNSSVDWMILRMNVEPGTTPAPLELRSNGPVDGETIFTMHHPNGAVQKTQSGQHDGGSISGFDFAGGSSGSALFDSSGRVIGGPLCCGGGCSVSFVSVESIVDAIENPPVPDNPLDVMVVFDRSGSMGDTAPPAGRTKLEEAQDAASLFTQLIREGGGDRLGLVTFSTSASTPVPPGPTATTKEQMVGPAPYTTGAVGAIVDGGNTSIGKGIEVALNAIGGGSGNDRALLLLSDGLQNTDPLVEDVEGMLGPTKLNVIGFGSDAEIDSALLGRVAAEHGGQFTRALDGLTLRKFFGLSFGNIFESGALSDPDYVLPASESVSREHEFQVCGEERITVILGWDRQETPLRLHVYTPKGKRVGGKRHEDVRGRTWVFCRVPLPFGGERDGTWHVAVDRMPTGGEFPPPPTDVRYFLLIVCAGGPKLIHLGDPGPVYTGDVVNPLVGLHYPDGTTPHAEVTLAIRGPGVALGQLTTEIGLQAPLVAGDTVDGFHATLQEVQRRAGGTLPVGTNVVEVPLFDDGMHDDGAFEPDGIYGNPLADLTRYEGTYEFHARATFGEGCTTTRETFWSVYVGAGVDPDQSDVDLEDERPGEGGKSVGVLVIFPRDRFRNPLGPGRRPGFTIAPVPGVTLTGSVKDRGDGSYAVDIAWDPAVVGRPGVVVTQPGRDPVVVVTPGQAGKPPEKPDCSEPAEKLLDCLGLPDSEVKHVKVKSVCVKIDLKDKDCC